MDESLQYIESINRAQQAYYAEYGQFSDSIAKLGLGIKEQTKDYNYRIVSSMGPVQTLYNHREPAQFESAIAIVKPTDSNPVKSYTGAVFAYKEKGSNLIRTITALCQSDRINASYAETWNPPTFDGTEIHCQPGTTMLR
ncbi:MAG TPA: type IV pilin-like G/H family protein [Microcoleus sp.]|nr:type IV pilin-like G/H family protein [Microcoleus sp.]